jgi:hypothetical protein
MNQSTTVPEQIRLKALANALEFLKTHAPVPVPLSLPSASESKELLQMVRPDDPILVEVLSELAQTGKYTSTGKSMGTFLKRQHRSGESFEFAEYFYT